MMELNRLAKLAGLKLSESDMDYRGSHQAPSMEESAPLYDMTMNGIYPADIYGPDGLRYYGDGMQYDNESMNVIRSVHNRPTAKVKMYRAVPKFQTNQEKIEELRTDMASFLRRGNVPSKYSNMPLKGSAWYNWAYDEIKRLEALPEEPPHAKLEINSGDWVTLSPSYARLHGQSNLNGKFKVLSKTVMAKELYTDGNSINEFGYVKG